MRAGLLLTLSMLAGCSTLSAGPKQIQASAKYLVPTPAVIAAPALRARLSLGDVLGYLRVFTLIRDRAARTSLDRVWDATGYDVALQMRTELERALNAADLEAAAQEVANRASLKFDWLAEPGDLFPDRDELPRGQASQVFVDTSVVYGFTARASNAGFQPYAVIEVVVVAADTLELRYQNSFATNFPTLEGERVIVPAPAGTPSWESVAALKADVAGASAALSGILAAIAAEIAVQLKAADKEVIFGRP